MRLLAITESGPVKAEIKEFISDIPPYAILSHRWGEEEVTLEDVQKGRHETKKGYQKLTDCLELARKRKHKYVWMDTCCIDKTSSVELSEAINSMYRWYQEAEECYAYLADVSDVSESQMAASEWFARGWTLQELIAPSALTFFNTRWEELGTKESRSQLVSDRTGIPISILNGSADLETISIARRMFWAAERTTTKTEDLAYCLLGIFGINIPLLYGEGERAFIRLQEEIMKVSDDHTIFAWKSPDQNHGGLLATSPKAFKESDDINHSHSLTTTNQPWTINNKGINVELPFIGVGHQGLGVAVLPCLRSGKKDSFLAVYLKDSFLTMERFERVWCEKLEDIDLTGLRPSQYPVKRICVRQRRLVAPGKKGGRRKLGQDCESDSSNLELFYRPMTLMSFTKLKAQPTSEENVTLAKVQPAHGELADKNEQMTLSYAAREGLVEDVWSLLSHRNIQVNSTDENGRTALSHAAGNGHVKVVWLLLARQNVKIDLADNNERTPVSHAAERGHDEVMWLLLNRGDVRAHSADANKLTPLFHAVRQGHKAIVEMFLARDDVRGCLEDSSTGRSVLSHASECGQEALVRLFLARSDIEPDTKDDSGRTPLLWAAVNKHDTVAQLLLDKGADPEMRDRSGLKLLLWAAENGHEAGVRLLLDNGADIETRDCAVTPLSSAVKEGHEAVVRLLLDKGASIEKNCPLAQAAENGHEAIVRLLLDKGADTEARRFGLPPLSWAVENGHETVVRLLLDAGADPNAAGHFGRMVLWYAVGKKDMAIARLLLDKGANPNGEDHSLLFWAVKNRHRAVVQLLLDKGADIEAKDHSGRTPLRWAVEGGNDEVVRLLLDRGADVEAKDHSGQTLLWPAVVQWNEVVLRLLLDNGVDVETKGLLGQTLLFEAAKEGHKAVARLLLDKGADTKARDLLGRTPLFWAVEGQSGDVVQLLLEKGAEVEAKDCTGQTPLSWAAEGQNGEVIQLLLDKGADVEAKDYDGRTPLRWAVEGGNDEAVRLLLDKGANIEAFNPV